MSSTPNVPLSSLSGSIAHRSHRTSHLSSQCSERARLTKLMSSAPNNHLSSHRTCKPEQQPIRATEGGISVWRKRSHLNVFENPEIRQNRFVGILKSLDIVAFLARDGRLEDQDKAMKTPVSKVLVPCNSLLKVVDPATRGSPCSSTTFQEVILWGLHRGFQDKRLFKLKL